MAPVSPYMRYAPTPAGASHVSENGKSSDEHSQFRIPECFAPGVFDIRGASHQIFHVMVLCAMGMHIMALMQAFTAFHTLDLCA